MTRTTCNPIEKTSPVYTDIPSYGEKPKKQGLYLGLFHGRATPNETMNDWGLNGPTIGPLEWCHTTYTTEIRLEFEAAEDAKRYFGRASRNVEMQIQFDMLVFQGNFFGDWTVYCIKPSDVENKPDSFRPNQRNNQTMRRHNCFYEA